MTRSLRILAMAAAASMLAAPCVLATDSAVLKVDVPFDFVVADRRLPSGEYRIERRPDIGLVRIYSKDQKHLVSLFSVPLPADVKKGGELEFHAHGNQRFLKTIRIGEGFAAYLPDSRSEKEAAQTTGGAVSAVGMP